MANMIKPHKLFLIETVKSKQENPLHAFRNSIDQIDGKILELLNRRTEAALEIGKLKKANNQPVYAPEREKAVIERLVKNNQGPLPNEAVEEIFQAIIHQVRTVEENDFDT